MNICSFFEPSAEPNSVTAENTALGWFLGVFRFPFLAPQKTPNKSQKCHAGVARCNKTLRAGRLSLAMASAGKEAPFSRCEMALSNHSPLIASQTLWKKPGCGWSGGLTFPGTVPDESVIRPAAHWLSIEEGGEEGVGLNARGGTPGGALDGYPPGTP
jgi:hypothetical protein